MARIEESILAVECAQCGKLHEVVSGHRNGTPGTWYRCRDELRSYVDLYDAHRLKTVTLGLASLKQGHEGERP